MASKGLQITQISSVTTRRGLSAKGREKAIQ